MEFGSALENFLTRNYKEALKISRKLYKENPEDPRIRDLYFRILTKMAIEYENDGKCKEALDYIGEAEKVKVTQEVKKIKKRIQLKNSSAILEENQKYDYKIYDNAFDNFLKGEYERALIILEKNYKDESKDEKVKDLYGKVLVKVALSYAIRGEYKEALDSLTKAEKIYSKKEIKKIRKEFISWASKNISRQPHKKNRHILKIVKRVELKKKILRYLSWSIIVIAYFLLFFFISTIYKKRRAKENL